ncbi:uncharacterized protein LOC101847982 [Aplysia californica]|uniref:Uncharacterized protein LOC101847982 n=1 Tax=Aplysia californica TaxID=6500 RepID=A0ABM0JYH2_APLCA|nr:uncharacterized protein LOC101847982 [Aplysia californica]
MSGVCVAMSLLTILVASCCVQWVVAIKGGFIKDQAMDAVFPGPVYKQDKSLPVGHMRPLGWQREPDGPIREFEEMPAAREFFEDFIDKSLPAVFRNGVKDAPAFTTWEDDNYLSQKYGHLNVSVRLKMGRHRDKVLSEGQVMKFQKFLFDYMYDELYLASVIPREMMDELPLPKCVRCGTVAERLLSSQLWMSSGGTSSLVHSHDDHLLHCVLFGRRDFILINGAHKKSFDYHDDYPNSRGGHSDMTTDMINVFRYKSIPNVPWIWSTLYAGDCLFVPAGYLHQVRSYGRSVSVTLEFAPLSSFDDTGCMLMEEEFVPLSDALYYLAFEEGELRLSETEMDAEQLRSLLLVLMGRDDVISENKFSHFYHEVLGTGKEITTGSDVFAYMTSGEGESQLTRKDVNSMSAQVLLEVATAFNEGYINRKKAREAQAKMPRTKIHRGLKEEF